MEEKIKTSDKVFKILVRLLIVITIVTVVLFGFIIYLDKQDQKELKQQAMAKLPIIEERVNSIIEENNDIYTIKHHFEYDGINFIEAYVHDTWFGSTDIEQKRFAMGISENVKSILFEEGFIKANDRLGIYVYSVDGIQLAESNMHGEIKLRD